MDDGTISHQLLSPKYSIKRLNDETFIRRVCTQLLFDEIIFD